MCEKSDLHRKPLKNSWKIETSDFPPARLFCGCFSQYPDLLDGIQDRLSPLFGPVIHKSRHFDFPDTRLYGPAMGAGLKKVFYVFQGLAAQDCLGKVKQATCQLEETIAQEGRWPVPRPINLDPGLVTEGHIVLASTKDRGHRLPRTEGIFEEITLLYFNGAFQPLMWTYQDFQDPEYHAFFAEVRKTFLQESKHLRKQHRAAAEQKRFE